MNKKRFFQIDIMELDGIKKNSIDNRVLQFGISNAENIKA